MFTSNQIEEIRQKLQLSSSSVKDTQFPIAEALQGEERLAIVQGGRNKQLPIRNFIDSIATWCKTDFINISKNSEEKYTLEEAIRQVDIINRRAGQVITYIDADTGEWLIYQFKGTDDLEWLILDKWDNILEKSDSHFKGWFLNKCLLVTQYPRPKVGDFAFVGEELASAVTYGCIDYGNWYNSNEPAIGDGTGGSGSSRGTNYTIDSIRSSPQDFYNDLSSNKAVYIDNKLVVYYKITGTTNAKTIVAYTFTDYLDVPYVIKYNALITVTLGSSGNEIWKCVDISAENLYNYFSPTILIEVDSTSTTYSSIAINVGDTIDIPIDVYATYFLQSCDILAKVKGGDTYWRLEGRTIKSITSSTSGSITRYMYLVDYNERYTVSISWNLNNKTLTTLATLIE